MENCEKVESTTAVCKPCLQDDARGGGGDDVSNNIKCSNRDSLQGVEFMSIDQCQKNTDMDDSKLVGNGNVAVRGDGGATVEIGAGDGVQVVEMMRAGKRRRGRPPRNQARIVSSSAPSPQRNKEDEEDVCFICFDGGSLVLCDRRGCPKAYHPPCIKRDEAFFKSKAKWNCGWHICSSCQKASHYMCYTCTYSLCKNCTKGADYVNVRGNKGFCGTCMRTVMLIENSALGNKEMVQVDFDDQASWEYLFKVYWILLKEKLSLNLDELTKAKNPWKEIAIPGPKGESSGELNNSINVNVGNGEKAFRDLGASSSKRRKTMKQQNFSNKVRSLDMNGMPLPEGINWATKELLEFVAHMKNGDTSMVSRFDVQALLLEYITRSNLRDPCHSSYIVCDSRLIKLFRKARVGHFEMLKLLDSHFLSKDHSRLIGRGGATKAFATQLAVDRNSDGQPVIANDKSCKTSKKVDGQPINVNKNGDGPLKGVDVVSDIGSRETSIPPYSTGMELSVNNIETDKIWHYKDPLGKTQGPFSMAMLGKWSMSGVSPSDLRIWRTSEKQADSILLTDAFDRQYSQGKQLFHNSCVPIKGVIASDDGCQDRDSDARENKDLNVNQMENKQVEESSKSTQSDTSGDCFGKNEHVKSKEFGSQSSPCSASVDIVNSNAEQMGSPLPHQESVKGDNYFPGQPQVSSSLPSSTVCQKPHETRSCEVGDGHGVERWDCGSVDMNEDLNKTYEGQIIAENVKQEDNDRKSGKSCRQSGTSSSLNDASNGWDLNSGLISLEKAFEVSEQNHDIDFSTLPTSTSNLNNEDSKRHATEFKQSPPSNVPHQDSGPSWSTVSSLVGIGSQLPEVAGEWGGYSSTLVKPSAEEWCSGLVSESSLKPTDLESNHSAIPTSGNGQMTHSSSTDPANNASGWDAIVAGPHEYPLGDESVSDLLAEVEAMESLNGLPSPTSILCSDGELAQGSEHNCFSPVGGLSPVHDPGKSNTLSLRNNLQRSSQSAVTNEQFGVSQSEVLDVHKSSGGHSSTSPEIDSTLYSTWRAGPETTGTNLRTVQGNANFNWGGSGQGNTNFSRGTAEVTFQENGSINASTSAGNPPYWGSQQRYTGPRDQGFEGRDSSFGRDRYSSNRQSSYDGPNGVGSSRPLPKGKRVCKFYESGYCKKGASCSYWHP
ncbi:hypothetical protein E1A91_D11G048900v1 [Gossypium mustelinum]|uniref:C3H1-type domain-containing protein n=1 Tax=Gossypium mustelinum TaxID=34275 RepID=A0A5D2SNA2_GOSMU|nr:hypothetical protein E1A91_D11G048900v1 [Gossypium mustelinum]